MPQNTSASTEAIEFPKPTAADAAPARKLWVELATRITTQRLHYRSGDEETAARSIYSLFDTTRKLLAEHGKGSAFDFAAVFILNRVIRPYTARWHGWMVEQRFRNVLARRRFRKELAVLRRRLEPFQELFRTLAAEASPEPALLAKCFGPLADGRIAVEEHSGSGLADMGADVVAGIGCQVPFFRPDSTAKSPEADLPPGNGAPSETRKEKLARAWHTIRKRLAIRVSTAEQAQNFLSPEGIDRVERMAIRARRAALGWSREEGVESLVNATGLCLSGGGIRSATFCLGIVQELAKRGMLAQFDYLSTGSGGGYLGAFLSAYLGTASGGADDPLARQAAASASTEAEIKARRRQIEEAFAAKPGGDESAAIRHLRNNSRYLLNGGLWGRLRIAGLLVSGILTNLLVVLPLPFALVLGVFGLRQFGYWEADAGSAWLHTAPALAWQSPAGRALVVLGAALAAFWAALPLLQNLGHASPPASFLGRLRTAWTTFALLLALLAAGAAALFLLPALLRGYVWLRDLLPSARAIPLTEEALGVATAVGTFLFGPLAVRLGAGWGKKLATVLFAISGPLLLLFLFLFAGSRLLLDPAVWDWETLAIATGALLAWSWFLLNVNTHGPHRYYRDRLCECYLATRNLAVNQRGWVRRFARWFVSGQGDGAREVGLLQRLPLSALGTAHGAPYHLINTTVNLPQSQAPNLRGRDSDFFVFTRDYCGGPICGYVPTAEIERLDPHFDLGTAMAVSGAAASSNMGVKTMHAFRFLLTLTNIRLGYWLRNPRRAHWRWLSRVLGAPGPVHLFSEMAGWMHEQGRYLNLSDGGHIENLAIYELLRRRCKYVVVVDAGQEPGMEAADLLLVQRYAAIDLGIEVEFDLSDLMLDEKQRTTRAYAVLGKIRYEPAKGDASALGWLVYLKLAVVGGEPGYVGDYRRQHPDFPHQSTGDQIYEEAQFEAYRALGEAAAKSLFDDELIEPWRDARAKKEKLDMEAVRVESIADWFQAMATSLLPDNDPAFSTQP